MFGWQDDRGEEFGLARELFGPSPSDAQLRALSNLLAHLAYSKIIEVGLFPRPGGKYHARLGRPFLTGQIYTTLYVHSKAERSQIKGGGDREWGVRLRPRIEHRQ